MPPPQNREELQRFLGMVNYYSQFIPNQSEITTPLRSLLKKDAAWIWSHEHTQAVEHLKEILSSQPVLRFFDPSKPVKLQVDASKSGLGACILQDGHLIAYASRSLTQAKGHYAQIEQELLAVVFSCERFNHYIYGRPVDVMSDHKPLVSITKKPLVSTSPRLQRLLLRLQKYEVNITYVSRNAKPLPIIKEGETARIRKGKTWEPAIVTAQHTVPRSFMVTTPDGTAYRRNRRHLLPTDESPLVIAGPPIDLPATPLAVADPLVGVTPPDGGMPSLDSSNQCSPQQTPPKCTSSGRTVRLPARFREDYIMN